MAVFDNDNKIPLLYIYNLNFSSCLNFKCTPIPQSLGVGYNPTTRNEQFPHLESVWHKRAGIYIHFYLCTSHHSRPVLCRPRNFAKFSSKSDGSWFMLSVQNLKWIIFDKWVKFNLFCRCIANKCTLGHIVLQLLTYQWNLEKHIQGHLNKDDKTSKWNDCGSPYDISTAWKHCQNKILCKIWEYLECTDKTKKIDGLDAEKSLSIVIDFHATIISINIYILSINPFIIVISWGWW